MARLRTVSSVTVRTGYRAHGPLARRDRVGGLRPAGIDPAAAVPASRDDECGADVVQRATATTRSRPGRPVLRR
jgi:hypothetical protein